MSHLPHCDFPIFDGHSACSSLEYRFDGHIPDHLRAQARAYDAAVAAAKRDATPALTSQPGFDGRARRAAVTRILVVGKNHSIHRQIAALQASAAGFVPSGPKILAREGGR